MSLITEKLWLTVFNGKDDKPMPEGMTYQAFTKLREGRWLDADIRDKLDYIKQLKTLQPNEYLSELVQIQQQELDELYMEKITNTIRG